MDKWPHIVIRKILDKPANNQKVLFHSMRRIRMVAQTSEAVTQVTRREKGEDHKTLA